ncbi:MAG: putative lipid II flippase FtsW [Christensenellaceae bacterium]|nr:putative lipid II flippase FtsW [Christensenellaceae bacterium]
MESKITAIRPKAKRRRGPIKEPKLEIKLPDGINRHGMDFPLFLAVIILCAFGVVMLFSASYYYAQSFQGDGYFYVKKQLMFLAVGIPVMFGVSFIDYTIYAKAARASYAVLLGLLVVVLFIGKSAQGAQRWIGIGPIQFQPSEFAKFVLVICMSKYMTERKNRMPTILGGLLPMFVLLLLPCALIYFQPNMSMIIILCIVAVIMLFIGGASIKQLAIPALAGAAGIAVLIGLAGYRSSRITAWLHPWEDVGGDSYQIIQSLYAFGNGGWFGQGLNASRQKLLFLPYRESDFILPIIGEELGFVVVALLLVVYAFVIYRGIRIALASRERFASLLAGGISSILAVQVLINVAVVTNSIPATGQTLPFVSAGGTSIVVFLAAMGILLNISRYIEIRK